MNKGIQAMQAYWQAKREGKASMGDGGAAAKPGKVSKPKAAALPARPFRVTLAVVHEGVRTAWSVDATAPTMRKAARKARELWRATKRPGAVEAVAAVFDKGMADLPANAS